MNIKRIIIRQLTENCYVFWDDEKNGGIIDPGGEFENLDKFISDNGILLKVILLTHSHYDHIGAAEELSQKYSIPVSMCKDEIDVLCEPENSLGVNFLMPTNFEYFSDGDVIKVGAYSLKVIATPGHTKGSVCFYEENEKIIFSGDTLFNSTVGRWDLPTGNYSDLENSILNKLYVLPDDVKVHSGHGFSTSIGREKAENGVIRC